MKYLLLILFWVALPAQAIIIRDDVPDKEYRVEQSDYPATAYFYLSGRLGSGTGTLIDPQWVLTAGHVGQYLEAGDRVTVHKQDYVIDEIVMHPEYSLGRTLNHDIALIKLDRKVSDVVPAKIYSSDDELGKQILFVGAGQTGNGKAGVATTDGLIRKADNTIESVSDQWISFVFKSPDDDGVLPLEGISGPGDSGGPAYWFDGDDSYVLGISSWQDNRAQGGAQGLYGVIEYYTRVSSYQDWIQAMISQ